MERDRGDACTNHRLVVSGRGDGLGPGVFGLGRRASRAEQVAFRAAVGQGTPDTHFAVGAEVVLLAVADVNERDAAVGVRNTGGHGRTPGNRVDALF